MKDCFPWLLNLYSKPCKPSNSKSRFWSPMFLKEEHDLKKRHYLKVLQQEKRVELPNAQL